jgi:hypothetical protein
MMKIQVLAWDMLWDHNPPHLRNWISNGNAELEKGNKIKVCTAKSSYNFGYLH